MVRKAQSKLAEILKKNAPAIRQVSPKDLQRITDSEFHPDKSRNSLYAASGRFEKLAARDRFSTARTVG